MALVAAPQTFVGETEPVAYGTPKAAETYKPGDWLQRDSNGLLVKAAAADANIGSGDVVGISDHFAVDILSGKYTRRGTGTAGLGAYTPFRPGQRLIMPLYHATPASAVITEANLDAPSDFEVRNAGGIWAVDVSATSNPKVRVEMAINDSYSVPNGFVRVVVLPAADLMDAVA